jgi:hypothetical protein
MTDLSKYKILKKVDSNNIVLIRTQNDIIDNLESIMLNRNNVIKEKDIQLNLVKAKARRDKWLIGGSLAGALISTLLISFLVK